MYALNIVARGRWRDYMKLNREEIEICKKYSARDDMYRVHCSECPLVIDHETLTCKRNISKKEYKKLMGE